MFKLKPAFIVAAFATAISGAHAIAQPAPEAPSHTGSPGRPADSTANLPSATGAQTTTPGGAVTGAGHAQVDTAGSGTGEGLQGRAVAADRQRVEEQREREAHATGERGAVGVTTGHGEGSIGSGGNLR